MKKLPKPLPIPPWGELKIENIDFSVTQKEIEMRKVEVFKQVGYVNGKPEKKKIGEAVFHEWGLDYNEFSEGAVSYSIAIIEHPDGTVESIPVNMIKFCIPQR